MKYLVALIGLCGVAAGLFLLRRPSIPAAVSTQALLFDFMLVVLFGLQHSGLAGRVSRAVFVSTTGIGLVFIAILWRDSGPIFWQLPFWLSVALALLGSTITAIAAFSLNARELLGLRDEGSNPEFLEPILHCYVRHPIYAGNILVFVAVPVMTADRMLFAVGMTIYILIGIQFEERKLLRLFGPVYSDYRRRVPMLLPWPKRLLPYSS